MKTLITAALVTLLVSGCITNPRGPGLTASLYSWDDRDNPLATVTTSGITGFANLFYGSALFSDLLSLQPNLDTRDAVPYVLEICDDGICHYSVLFPAFFEYRNDNVVGFATINELTTTFYHEVSDRPQGEVLFYLDQYAAQVIAGEVPGYDNGSIGYEDVAYLDYYLNPEQLSLLQDAGIASLAATAIGGGSETSISQLLTGSDSGAGGGSGDDSGGGDSGGDSGGDTGGDSGGDSGGDAGADNSNALLEAWVLNDGSERSRYIIESDSNNGVLVNVQSVQDNGSSVRVSASGIPDYLVEITQAQVDWLNSRPRANSDFASGRTTVRAGSTIVFGQDIGYNSSSRECTVGEGYGYWPPGPGCPTDQGKVIDFPVQPAPASDDCETGAGAVGYYVNGTSVYNWTDAQTYLNEGVWQTLAPVAEVYDVDICGGHAANGDYHHHFYSECLAELVGDTGNGHSPIYGFAADGYPIYGPWEANGELARSSWAARDYDSPQSDTGCGSAGVRSCLLVDQYDPGAGTVAASSNGPTTSGSFTSLSNNTFDTPTGFFFEDWYWDSNLAQQGGAWLDQYNGHSDSERGYHYHVTIEFVDGVATPSFPYSVGPRYAGELQDNASASCAASGGGMGGGSGGGGGMPPRGG